MKITEVLQVLSDSTRLRMLRLLEQQELSVAELQEILEMGQSRISSHLGLLRRNNLVFDRKDGKRTYYTLDLDASSQGEFIRLAISGNRRRNFGKPISQPSPGLLTGAGASPSVTLTKWQNGSVRTMCLAAPGKRSVTFCFVWSRRSPLSILGQERE